MTVVAGGESSGVLRCAEWLHSVVPCWLDADVPLSLEEAIDELRTHLNCVSAYAEKGGHLPVKTALRVQVIALDCWNTTALAGWPLERKYLKVQARWLVTHLFLCSHCVFANQEVCEAHLSHHPDDAEKCILMCLKTSKGLVQTNRTDAAEQALTWATRVVTSCNGTTTATSKMQRFSAEIQFAQLHAAWDAGQHQRACVIAAQLADVTRWSVTYTEALFEFIYDVGVRVLSDDDAPTHVLDKNTQGLSQDEGVKPSDCASELAVSDIQASLQALLLLSLRLQGKRKVCTLKQRTFLGMTQLQYGYSLLISGNYDAAAKAAAHSYDLLRTVEPLVICFKAEVYRKSTDQVLKLFGVLCDDNTVDVEKLCAMATLAMEKLSDIQVTLFQTLDRRVAASENDLDQFRLLCVLIHHFSEWSVEELLRRLSDGAAPPPPFRRFLFCCLWRLSVEVVMPDSSCLLAPTRWRCLETAQRLFRDTASKAELQGVLLDMAHIGIQLNDGGTDAKEMLEKTLRLCLEEEPIDGALAPSFLESEAQLAFILGHNEEGMSRVNALLACATGEEARVRACCQIISFLLQTSLLDVSGAVAELCIVAFHQHQPPSCVLEFAKVFAMGCLVQHVAELRDQVGSILVLYVCPLLQRVVLSITEAQWWSRFLWYASEALLDCDPVRAVRLLHTGIELDITHGKGGAKHSASSGDWLLRDRISLLLDTEFDLFAAGHASLPVDELCKHCDHLASLLSACEEGNNVLDPCITARQRLTLLLARLEATLLKRLACDVSTPVDIDALHLDELPNVATVTPGDLEQVAVGCHRVAPRLPPHGSASLSDAALTLMLEAIKMQLAQNISSTPALGALYANLFTAFKMARNGDGRLQVFDVLTAALPRLTSECASLRSAVLRAEDDAGHSPGVGEVLGICETVVEFFAVEAWNESVQWNVLCERALVERWRATATTLASVLSDTNPSKAAITDLAVQMPLL